MISLRSGQAVVILEEGTGTAFVDRDWIAAAGDGPVTPLWAADATEAAGLLLAAADHIVSLVGAPPHGTPTVLGEGLIARSVRAALAGGSTPSERPRALIDCAADPARLLESIPRVQDGGIVVLAGEPQGRELAIDLYVDVHRRGLRMIGAPRPEAHAPVTDEARIRHALDQLERVKSGEAPPAAAPWFTVG